MRGVSGRLHGRGPGFEATGADAGAILCACCLRPRDDHALDCRLRPAEVSVSSAPNPDPDASTTTTIGGYHDGCQFSKTCLACPLPKCIQEMPGGVRSLRKGEKRAALRRLVDAGFSVPAAAAEVGVDARHAYALLRVGGLNGATGGR